MPTSRTTREFRAITLDAEHRWHLGKWVREHLKQLGMQVTMMQVGGDHWGEVSEMREGEAEDRESSYLTTSIQDSILTSRTCSYSTWHSTTMSPPSPRS